MLNDIELYCGTWVLKINTSKTKAVIFEKGRHTNYDFYLKNIKLEVVNLLNVSVFTFSKNGNWFRTQKRLVQHASYALQFIINFQSDRITGFS